MIVVQFDGVQIEGEEKNVFKWTDGLAVKLNQPSDGLWMANIKSMGESISTC